MKKAFEVVDSNEVTFIHDHELEDGSLYTGQMKRVIEDGIGMLVSHGRGKQKWPDWAKYEGDWRNGKIEGRGTFYHENRDLYTGEFVNDKANGYGAYIHDNG